MARDLSAVPSYITRSEISIISSLSFFFFFLIEENATLLTCKCSLSIKESFTWMVAVEPILSVSVTYHMLDNTMTKAAYKGKCV